MLDIWLLSFVSLTEGARVDEVEGRSGSVVNCAEDMPLAIVESVDAGSGAVLLGGAIDGAPVEAVRSVSFACCQICTNIAAQHFAKVAEEDVLCDGSDGNEE